MNTFKINRNSWHYKFNKNFFNENGYSEYAMQDYWEPKHNNFCSYWRSTFIRMTLFLIIATLIVAVAAFLGFAVVMHTTDTLIAAGVIIGFLAVVAISIVLVMVFNKGIKKGLDKIQNSDNLFIQKYRVHKSKICPILEYKK